MYMEVEERRMSIMKCIALIQSSNQRTQAHIHTDTHYTYRACSFSSQCLSLSSFSSAQMLAVVAVVRRELRCDGFFFRDVSLFLLTDGVFSYTVISRCHGQQKGQVWKHKSVSLWWW